MLVFTLSRTLFSAPGFHALSSPVHLSGNAVSSAWFAPPPPVCQPRADSSFKAHLRDVVIPGHSVSRQNALAPVHILAALSHFINGGIDALGGSVTCPHPTARERSQVAEAPIYCPFCLPAWGFCPGAAVFRGKVAGVRSRAGSGGMGKMQTNGERGLLGSGHRGASLELPPTLRLYQSAPAAECRTGI